MTPKTPSQRRPAAILLVEDNPGEVRLVVEALKEGGVVSHLSVAHDGVEALEFLQRSGIYADAPRPDLILLDLNLPRKDGREFLGEIKNDPALMMIPVVVITTSDSDQDVADAYRLHANCYITKPFDLETFVGTIQSVRDFWIGIVRLPGENEGPPRHDL